MTKTPASNNSNTNQPVNLAPIPKLPPPDRNFPQAEEACEDWGFLQMKTSNNAHVILSGW